MKADALRTFVDRLPEGVLVVSSNGVVQLANTKASHLLNRSPDALESSKLSAVSRLTDSEVCKRLKACMRSRQPVPIAITFVDDEDVVIKLKMTGFLFTPASEGALAQIMLRLLKTDSASSQFIALNKEIENQQKTMRLLVQSKTKLQKAREELSGYIDILDKYVISSATDLDGNIVRVSEAFCDISKYSRDELIGKHHSIVRHPDMPDSIFEDLWKTIKRGSAWHGEFKNRAKDGSTYYVEVNIEPEFNEHGDIMGYTAIRQDITDKKRVEKLSQRDPLTKIYNRLKLDAVLEQEIERAQRYHTAVSIILLDIDYFKKINDKYGHLVGDKALVELADILTKRTRDVDTVGRWGGEEFLIVCPGTDLSGAERLAEDIRQSILEHSFLTIGNITCTFGVSAYQHDDDDEALLKRADEALYDGKAAGRNLVKSACKLKRAY